MELKFIKDMQRAGIEAAKAEGVYKGRKKMSMMTKSAAELQRGPARPVSRVI